MFQFTANYTDLYQISMAQVYFNQNKHEHTAVFDYFFRKNPFKGGYTIFAGLEELLEVISNLHFSEEDLAFLKKQGFTADFLEYLKNFKFKGNIYSVKEGDVVFPTRPVLQVEANFVEAQLVETLLLNLLNFQSLIATKASRIRLSAGNKKILDFGLRRAQGPGGYFATKAAIIGGANGSSNVKAAQDYNLPVAGTMAHSFVQSYDDELTAFRDFAEGRPKDCVLLVDTYSTLKSGVPNAIKVAKEMEKRGEKLMGIRLDSGDLAYYAKQSRAKLDEAGLEYVKIAVSNQLDEYVIKSLEDQNAPIDVFGVGTNMVIGKPDAALDGVYKLAFSNGKPRIKISENIAKITLPHKKQVYRMSKENGMFSGADVITMASEKEVDKMYHPFEAHKELNLKPFKHEALLQPVMKEGQAILKHQNLTEVADFAKYRLSLLPLEYKRFDNPHIYKIGLSAALKQERDKLIATYKLK
ncbi:nicotinate phosphoribosyltransferase [Haloflavibacter putidus]|uniref:Nicotinate phosphoribosyltransferase n=1 Tax=Haloflavibacter putidus TaxID=2576776 RepID=A0A507ZIH5_9FLAO|nr:nicotinate phosphoribosyltransferase [Haloflavibacter putidus]TQD36989.1 nicotinate phosphoribosyltransferase [Haloflavibacter putidus]